MNITEIAQKLVNGLQDELNKTTEQHTLIRGAIEGVQLLHSKIVESQTQETDNEQHSKAKVNKTKGKAKK